MFAIYDDFTKSIHSRHRTPKNAAKALKRHKKKFYENNSSSSYLPWEMVQIVRGEIVAATDEQMEQFDRAFYLT